MLAVLEDAVLTLSVHARGRSAYSQRLVTEVEAWIASNARTHPFAFATICDVFGVDVSYLRKALGTWKCALESPPKYRRMYAGRGRHQLGSRLEERDRS